MGTLKSRRYRYRRFTRAPLPLHLVTRKPRVGRWWQEPNGAFSRCQYPSAYAVIVHALDRFSRSRLDHALYKSLLKKAGIHRLAKLDTERERLSEKRTELERLKAKVVAIPTLEMLRQIGDELRKR